MNQRAGRQTFLSSASVALAVLTLINLLNYLDRFVVSALAETLKHSSLALSDFKLGSLMTSFLLVYLFTAPVFGALGDRRSVSYTHLDVYKRQALNSHCSLPYARYHWPEPSRHSY